MPHVFNEYERGKERDRGDQQQIPNLVYLLGNAIAGSIGNDGEDKVLGESRDQRHGNNSDDYISAKRDSEILHYSLHFAIVTPGSTYSSNRSVVEVRRLLAALLDGR
jgi:hypothetical protein